MNTIDRIKKPASKWERSSSWKKIAISIGGTVVIFCCFAVILYFIVSAILRSTYIYNESLNRAKASIEVTDSLGIPVKEGWLVIGNINTHSTGDSSSGHAVIKIPVSGPNGSGKLFAEAEKSGNRWNFTMLGVKIDGSGRYIDLLGR